MPYKRRAKRRVKRKRRYRNSPQNALTSYRPLKRTQLFKCRYFERVVIDPGPSGSAATILYTANGLYDPRVAVGGHQPIGFDQLVGVMYDHYVVIAAKCTFIAQNIDAASQTISISLQDDTTLSTNEQSIMENGNVKFKTLGPLNSGSSQKTLVAQCNPVKFLGHSKPLSDDVLKGDVSSNPAEQAYFALSAWPTSTADTLPVQGQVIIDYVAILFEPKKLPTS